MNKGEIRTRVLEQVDWSPSQSPEFKAKVDRLINRAYQQLALEAPFLFFEEEARIITQADVSTASDNTKDVLAVNTEDLYVLERKYTSLTVSAGDTPQSWSTDGDWDGRMIQVERSDGQVLRRRIREIWQDSSLDVSSGVTTFYDRISIDHPWPNASDTGMSYRIFTDVYELPADVVELRSARIFADTHYQLEVMAQNEMERYEYTDYRGNDTGRPYRIFRGRHFQIDAPTSSPAVTLKSPQQAVDAWVGPDPAGEFDYCYTYVWGLRDNELEAPVGFSEPKWESAPSPISEKIVHPGSPVYSILVKTPNIDQILNFYEEFNTVTKTIVTPVRSKRSGLRKRIYMRRYDQFVPPAGAQKVEASEIFFLLTEIDGHKVTYTHDGSDIPDYYRRLKETHGYQSVRLWPMPDERYEVDLRVLRRPQPLVHDHDAPRVHEEAVDALIQRALSFLYEYQGNSELATFSLGRYSDLLQTLTKRYGQITGLRPRKVPARIRQAGREVRVVYKA